jgi:biotin synthase
MNLDKILAKDNLEHDEITFLLSLSDKDDIRKLYDAAYKVKVENVGKTVHLRGIIEFSNICVKDCRYCGIRRSNSNVERFRLSKEEILEAAEWVYKNRYGSVVLQSGERTDAEYIDFVEDVLREIKKLSNGKLGITISLGEQEKETYQRWFEAGAHRYLLRVETSSRKLYSEIHPPDCSFDRRLECLGFLKETGYQVGTGVMIGIPGQTPADLADDVLFFRKIDADMIGMGPFIPHHDTPMASEMDEFDSEAQLELGLKMVAVTRLVLKDVNIAAATALQALKNNGRELGLMAGANIIMPNATATEYRASYQLYDNKPCLDENSTQCKACLTNRVQAYGETIELDAWGDSPHFRKRKARL